MNYNISQDKVWTLPRESHIGAGEKDFKCYFDSLMDDYFQKATSYNFIDDYIKGAILYENLQENKSDLLKRDQFIDDYIETVRPYNFIDDEDRTRLKKICDSLKKIISTYLDGLPGEAYIEFDKLMNNLKFEFAELIVMKTYTKAELIEIKQEINREDPNFENFKKDEMQKSINESKYQHPLERLYRIRATDELAPDFKKEDLFHRSFKDYKNINNYRFSIPGYPCLYLGSSFEVCYEECQKPKLEEIWLMKYTLKEPHLKLIDLTKTPKEPLTLLTVLCCGLKEQELNIINEANITMELLPTNEMKDKETVLKELDIMESDFDRLKDDIKKKTVNIKQCVAFLKKVAKFLEENNESFAKMMENRIVKNLDLLDFLEENNESFAKMTKNLILIHPIQIACSIKKAENSVFTPEYIIPQLLMQWLKKDSEFYGVKYNSTQCIKNNSSDTFNLALPARDNSGEYCKELLEKFILNEPVHVIEKIGIQGLISDISTAFSNDNFSGFNNHL